MSSAAIMAEIKRLEAQVARLEKEKAQCEQLVAELTKISGDVGGCVTNLKGVYNYLEIGLTNDGKPIGGENINERKERLNKFQISTNAAIAKVQQRIAAIVSEIAALKARIAALYVEYYAALEAERLAAERAASNNRALTGYRY